MLAIVLPQAATQWYVPFLEVSIKQPGIDPWHAFLNSGGTMLAFPYGYVMWLVFLPLTVLIYLVGLNLYWGYGLTILAVDLGLLVILQRLISISDRKLLLVYWLSPILLFASYWLGLNDIIPVSLLCLALLNIKRFRMTEAGVLCGLAVSAKLSMVLAVPLFGIYLYRNKSLRNFLMPFLIGLSGTLIVFGLPFVLSRDALQMLLSNPEMAKIYDLALQGGIGTKIYVLPMVYTLTLFLAWSIRRISFDLFLALLCIAFFLVLLLTPASPGWFIWVIPFLVFYQAKSGSIAIALVGCFTLLYIVTTFLISPPPSVLGSHIIAQFASNLISTLGERGSDLLHTLLLTFGIILVIRIWRETVRNNDFFRISRRPLVIGIAGDSGSGKDTLVKSLIGLLGHHSVVTLSGDDYHFWDRHKPMWEVMTHLNPRANDLEQFAQDLITLADGKAIQSRHYDHASGRKSRSNRIMSNDFIIASGLHALYLPIMRKCYNLSIYLDIDEGLRRYFKIQRDVHERHHSFEKVLNAIEKREADGDMFIRPQAAHADLVLSLKPIHPLNLENTSNTNRPRLKLTMKAGQGIIEESLVRVLIGICGLHVDMALSGDNSEVELTIEGETSSEDVALAVQTLLPEMVGLLDINPLWEDGMKGLIQLVVLAHIKQTLQRRLIL